MPKKLTPSQKYYRKHKKESNARTKKYYEKHKKELNEKARDKYHADIDKSRELKREARAINHAKYRDKDLEDCKEYYETHKEYHKAKNRQHYLENGDKWRARRREITMDWALARASKTLVSATLAEAGIDISVDTDFTTFQLFALIESLGLSPEDCLGYEPFKSRYDRYYEEYKKLK